jgi:hypothetical protein
MITPKVVEHAKKYFNCDSIEGVELEDQGGTGSSGSHWEQRILLGEYMGAVIYQEEMVISEFTLAALEDSGWYKVNYYTGGLMRFGKNKGCKFLEENCYIVIQQNSKMNFLVLKIKDFLVVLQEDKVEHIPYLIDIMILIVIILLIIFMINRIFIQEVFILQISASITDKIIPNVINLILPEIVNMEMVLMVKAFFIIMMI